MSLIFVCAKINCGNNNIKTCNGLFNEPERLNTIINDDTDAPKLHSEELIRKTQPLGLHPQYYMTYYVIQH